MPNTTPVTRYLLAGLAFLMFAAALPVAEKLVHKRADIRRQVKVRSLDIPAPPRLSPLVRSI